MACFGRRHRRLQPPALHDDKLPGSYGQASGDKLGSVRYREIVGAHRKLTACIQGLRNIKYYLLLDVRRRCMRSELERWPSALSRERAGVLARSQATVALGGVQASVSGFA